MWSNIFLLCILYLHNTKFGSSLYQVGMLWFFVLICTCDSAKPTELLLYDLSLIRVSPKMSVSRVGITPKVANLSFKNDCLFFLLCLSYLLSKHLLE